MAVNRG